MLLPLPSPLSQPPPPLSPAPSSQPGPPWAAPPWASPPLTSLLSSKHELPEHKSFFSSAARGQQMYGAANGVIHLTAACGRRWKTIPAQNRCGSSCWSRKSRCRSAPVRVRLRVGVRVRVRVSVSPLTLTLTLILTLSLTPILTLTGVAVARLGADARGGGQLAALHAHRVRERRAHPARLGARTP